MNKCEWCDLSDKEKEWLLFETKYWSIYLADKQDYVGRCILVLGRHCASLADLNVSEWVELKEIIDRLECCYKEVLGAELCNWSCLMNSFHKEQEPNPHLHIHARPRYRKAITINNIRYEDTEYGHHYAVKKDAQLLDEERRALFDLMKSSFNQCGST